jgi:hypothetical protein
LLDEVAERLIDGMPLAQPRYLTFTKNYIVAGPVSGVRARLRTAVQEFATEAAGLSFCGQSETLPL